MDAEFRRDPHVQTQFYPYLSFMDLNAMLADFFPNVNVLTISFFISSFSF